MLRQSTRTCSYTSALRALAAMDLIYPCFCTRAEIAAEIARSAEAPQGPDGHIYPGTCRQLPVTERIRLENSGAPYALRLNSAMAAERSDGLCFEELPRLSVHEV